jgi:hypothetical protein
VRINTYLQNSNLEKLPGMMILVGVFFALAGTFFGKHYFEKRQNIWN